VGSLGMLDMVGYLLDSFDGSLLGSFLGFFDG
jgi:hypothetical protein